MNNLKIGNFNMIIFKNEVFDLMTDFLLIVNPSYKNLEDLQRVLTSAVEGKGVKEREFKLLILRT